MARIDTPTPKASSRRVVIKMRVAQVGTEADKRGAERYVAYIDRKAVENDGSPGRAFADRGPAGAEGSAELDGERHQFQVIISPEDGYELDLHTYARTFMQGVEQDLGRKLIWLAAVHHDTDDPHVHVVIRGIDTRGREVWIDPEYISHGMRNRAREQATRELGPVTAMDRQRRLEREVALHRYTSLDSFIERGAVDGAFRERPRDALGRRQNPARDGAIRRRLEVLERLGLVSWKGRDEWALSPRLGAELRQMQSRAQAMRVIQEVTSVDPARCQVIDRQEPTTSVRERLDRGVQGVVLWKGLDEAGRFCAVIETTAGTVYHLPLSPRAADRAGVGQVVQLKRSVDKDERIERVARAHGWRYDVATEPERLRPLYRKRLEQLERLELAQRTGEGVWVLRDDFRHRVYEKYQQAYWQMLGLRMEPQRLEAQPRYLGPVWLDRVPSDELGSTGFGAKVRNARSARHDYLRELGLDPSSDKLRWQLLDLQQAELTRELARKTGKRPLPAREGFEGTMILHERENGERFAEIRSDRHFVLRSLSSADAALVGERVRLQLDGQGYIGIALSQDDERAREARHLRAIQQMAAAAPAASAGFRVIEPGQLHSIDRQELEGGVAGVIRWSGVDPRGRCEVIVEAANGRVYHVPVGRSQAESLLVGQLCVLSPTVGKDERIEEAARAHGGVYELAALPEQYRPAYRRHLAELEGLGLVTPLGADRWQVGEGLRGRNTSHEAQPVAIRVVSQSLETQACHRAGVWLDRLRAGEIGEGTFANELRDALLARQQFVRELGLDPSSDKLRWQLRDLQQAELTRELAAGGAGVAVRARRGFEGTLHIHRTDNGDRFVEVRGKGQFVLAPAPAGLQIANGQRVSIERIERGRIVLASRQSEKEPAR